MPMLTTLRIGLAGVAPPFAASGRARRTRPSGRAPRAPRVTTSVPSTISERPRGIRSATCSTGRSSVTLIRSPANIASPAPATPASSASARAAAQRLVGDAVLGVVEVEAGALGDQSLAAAGVGGEQLAQVPPHRRRSLPLRLGAARSAPMPGGGSRGAAAARGRQPRPELQASWRRGLDDALGREPELALDLLQWRRGAEGVHADDGPARAHVAVPAERRGLLDRDPGVDRGRQHALAIFLGCDRTGTRRAG